MSNLLIDIGNSRIKWATELDGKLSVGESRDSTPESIEALVTGLWSALGPQQVLVSCVASEQVRDTLQDVEHELCAQGLEFLSAPKRGAGISNAYDRPETMGPDRWAAMVAAFHREQGAVCVVSCGTAMTLDVINSQGQHQGGLILPGYQLLQHCISDRAAGIQLEDNESASATDRALGQSTRGCLQQGSLAALQGAISQVMTQNEVADMNLVLTGGDAERVANGLPWPLRIEPDLVLKGLAIIIHSHEKESLL